MAMEQLRKRMMDEAATLKIPHSMLGFWRDLQTLGARASTRACRLMPTRFRNWLGKPAPVVVLVPNGDHVDVWYEENGERHLLGASGREAPIDRGAMDTEAGIALCLPADQVVIRRVHFPDSVGENIASAVRFEFDRLTPFPVDAVYHSVSDVEPIENARRVAATLIYVPRATADEALALCREAGFTVDRLRVVGPNEKTQRDLRGILPSPPLAELAYRFRYRLSLAACLGILLIGLAVIPFHMQNSAEARLAAMAAERDQMARLLSTRQHDLQLSVSAMNSVLFAKHSETPILPFLLDMSEKLPTDCTIEVIDADRHKVRLSGRASSTTDVLQALKRSSLIDDVALAGPTTTAQQGDSEHFTVEARWRSPS